MTPSEVIREARNVLFERGWNRGGFEGADGSVCLVGAVSCAAMGAPEFDMEEVTEHNRDQYEVGLKAIYFLEMSIGCTPSYFNDMAASLDEVLEELDRAEKLAERREAELV